MPKEYIVLGDNLVKENVDHSKINKPLRQMFSLGNDIEYDGKNYAKGIYKPTLEMYMVDEEAGTNETLLSVTWYGEFYFPDTKGHIKENDLFGCLKILSGKIQSHLDKKHGIKTVVLIEAAGLNEVLYAFIKSTQSSVI